MILFIIINIIYRIETYIKEQWNFTIWLKKNKNKLEELIDNFTQVEEAGMFYMNKKMTCLNRIYAKGILAKLVPQNQLNSDKTYHFPLIKLY